MSDGNDNINVFYEGYLAGRKQRDASIKYGNKI
jgi:hypothetical protein